MASGTHTNGNIIASAFVEGVATPGEAPNDTVFFTGTTHPRCSQVESYRHTLKIELTAYSLPKTLPSFSLTFLFKCQRHLSNVAPRNELSLLRYRQRRRLG